MSSHTKVKGVTDVKMKVAVVALMVSGALAFAALPLQVQPIQNGRVQVVAPKCGINKTQYIQPCGNNEYRKGVFTCHDGVEKVINPGLCFSQQELLTRGQAECANRCTGIGSLFIEMSHKEGTSTAVNQFLFKKRRNEYMLTNAGANRTLPFYATRLALSAQGENVSVSHLPLEFYSPLDINEILSTVNRVTVTKYLVPFDQNNRDPEVIIGDVVLDPNMFTIRRNAGAANSLILDIPLRNPIVEVNNTQYWDVKFFTNSAYNEDGIPSSPLNIPFQIGLVPLPLQEGTLTYGAQGRSSNKIIYPQLGIPQSNGVFKTYAMITAPLMLQVAGENQFRDNVWAPFVQGEQLAREIQEGQWHKLLALNFHVMSDEQKNIPVDIVLMELEMKTEGFSEKNIHNFEICEANSRFQDAQVVENSCVELYLRGDFQQNGASTVMLSTEENGNTINLGEEFESSHFGSQEIKPSYIIRARIDTVDENGGRIEFRIPRLGEIRQAGQGLRYSYDDRQEVSYFGEEYDQENLNPWSMRFVQ